MYGEIFIGHNYNKVRAESYGCVVNKAHSWSHQFSGPDANGFTPSWSLHTVHSKQLHREGGHLLPCQHVHAAHGINEPERNVLILQNSA